MSANFTQISGPGGRIQTLTPSSSVQTFLFNPKALKGTLPGGDYLYVERARVRITGTLSRIEAVAQFTPNWQQLAQAFGQVRIYSPFLGEMVNKTLTSVPLLANHDAMFANGFATTIRERDQLASSISGQTRAIEYEFEIPFARDYLFRREDSCPWLGFFEGGDIEIDLRPADALAGFGWTMSGAWSCELVLDWYPDKQAIIHAPVQSRTYRVVTVGPEYTLKGVGSPQGLDGVVKGCRLAVLSWLGSGDSESEDEHDNGYYSSFQSGGILFGTANVRRLDIPFRDQVSIDAVSSWISSFLAETSPTRHLAYPGAAGVGASSLGQNDMAQWPYARNYLLTFQQQSLINDGLDFFPLVWVSPGQKIVDLQKVDGDLSFTADLVTPPENEVLHLFRTDEVCAFTRAKVKDLMGRMGLVHIEDGGHFDYVVKYAGAKRAADSTQWGLPLKIVAPAKKAA